MKQKLKCFLGIFLSLALVLSLMPCMSLTVHADTTKAYADYDVTTDANKDKSVEELAALQVNFNGKPWYIIEDNSTALNAGTVTLLAADESFDKSKFYNSINKYSISTIKNTLENMTTGDGPFTKVANAIKTVKVKGSDSDDEVDAKLYLLSVDEAEKVPQNVRKFTAWWWLRSPAQVANCARYVNRDGKIESETGGIVTGEGFVRPALKLDLSAVTFESDTRIFTVKPYVSLKNTTTKVHFNSMDWHLIDFDATTVTLLAADDSFGTSAFKSDGSSDSYNNSTVKEYLDSIVAGTAEEGKPNFAAVADAIMPVTLTTPPYESTG